MWQSCTRASTNILIFRPQWPLSIEFDQLVFESADVELNRDARSPERS